MNEQDRIRLAEAMGRQYKFHDGTTAPNVFSYFRPDQDANDDYAVLEWMREHVMGTENEPLELWLPQHQYQIGNFARAALKVLDDECTHEWVDPSNEVITSNDHVICTKCGLVRRFHG